MRRKKLNKNAYVLKTADSSCSLYFNGELVAVSNSAGDVVIDEDIDEQALNTVDQFVELLNSDNPLVFEIPRERLKTVILSLPNAPIFYNDWRG
jgi:hypothetical protein